MLCPRCDYQGVIYKLCIDALDKIVYWCDECSGTWENPSKILLYGKGAKDGHDFYSLAEYLENHGLKYMKTPITDLGKDWDKSVLGDDSLVLCPVCYPHGLIYKIKLRNDSTVYSCDNEKCDATWLPNEPIDTKKYVKFADFLKQNGLEYSSNSFESFKLLRKE